jgi:hypothetical protein
MVNQYQPGDIVTSSLVKESDFIGVVRAVDPKINKVWVAWGGGSVSQHDPDEIHFEPHQSDLVRSRMSSRRPVLADDTKDLSVNPSDSSAPTDMFASDAEDNLNQQEGKTAADPQTDPQFVGNPDKHGLETPISGGFGIMQTLAEQQRKEMNKEVKNDSGDPRVAMRSRRAMYWSAPSRVYRITRREIVDDTALCPKCKKNLELEPYTKSDRMYRCPECSFKVPKSSVIITSGLKSRRS